MLSLLAAAADVLGSLATALLESTAAAADAFEVDVEGRSGGFVAVLAAFALAACSELAELLVAVAGVDAAAVGTLLADLGLGLGAAEEADEAFIEPPVVSCCW